MNLRIRQLEDGSFLPEKEVETSRFFGLSSSKCWKSVGITYETEEEAISAIREYCEEKELIRLKAKQSQKYKPRYFKSDQFRNIQKYKKIKFN